MLLRCFWDGLCFFFNEKSLVSKCPQKVWTLMKCDFSDRRCFIESYCYFFSLQIIRVPFLYSTCYALHPTGVVWSQHLPPRKHCSAYCSMPYPQELIVLWRCSERAAWSFPTGAMGFGLAYMYVSCVSKYVSCVFKDLLAAASGLVESHQCRFMIRCWSWGEPHRLFSSGCLWKSCVLTSVHSGLTLCACLVAKPGVLEVGRLGHVVQMRTALHRYTSGKKTPCSSCVSVVCLASFLSVAILCPFFAVLPMTTKHDGDCPLIASWLTET